MTKQNIGDDAVIQQCIFGKIFWPRGEDLCDVVGVADNKDSTTVKNAFLQPLDDGQVPIL